MREQDLVELLMFATMHGFLADEGGDGLLQLGIADAIAVAAHAVDEEALADRQAA